MIVAPNYVGYYSHLTPQKQPHATMASLQSAPRDGRSDSLPNPTTPFSVEFGAFLSPLGIPCNAPPWGELAAVDLSTNQVIWRHWLGTTRDRAPLGLPLPLGVPTLGGPVATGVVSSSSPAQLITIFAHSTYSRARNCGESACPVAVKLHR